MSNDDATLNNDPHGGSDIQWQSGGKILSLKHCNGTKDICQSYVYYQSGTRSVQEYQEGLRVK